MLVDNTITVVIPVKDRKESLKRALLSVKKQTYPVKEIVVVDDGSSENLDEVKSEFPDVKFLRNENSMGAPYSRNLGWKSTNSRWISFLDSDDEMTPDCLMRKIELMQTKKLKLVVGSFLIEQDGETKTFKFKVDGNLPLRNNLLMNHPFDARTSTIVVEREVLQHICFDERLKKHQDWDLFINIDYKYPTGFTNDADVILHISGTDRISSNLKHDSTLYFVEKNQNKVSPDAMFLFLLKMIYKSVIRNDKYGEETYRKLLLKQSGLSYKNVVIQMLIGSNILSVSFMHSIKQLIRR